jgi:hypothetical protein
MRGMRTDGVINLGLFRDFLTTTHTVDDVTCFLHIWLITSSYAVSRV